MTEKIAFQGEFGAYSHQACCQARPEYDPLPCKTFSDAADAVRSGVAELAALPVENSIYGRVADIHQLLPETGLFVVDEALVRIRISLLGKSGTCLEQIRSAFSHTVLLGQCRNFLRENGISGHAWADTAGAAKHVRELNDSSKGALASSLAGEYYGLEELATSIEDQKFSRTRFFIMSREINSERRGDNGMIMAFMFRVRNIPAALYKALGGFATNQVNMVKLESYMLRGTFKATQFFAEIEGHPDDQDVTLALEELKFFTDELQILGVYPAAAERNNGSHITPA